MLFAAGLIILYSIFLLLLLLQWNRIPVIQMQPDISVSVIVPFRNEAPNMKRLIHYLDKVDYPNHEVIFVNDHSEDKGLDLLVKLLPKTLLNYRIINLEEEQGKKAAIAKAVSLAKGALIVTTDADCIMDKNWLNAMVAHFEDTKIHLVTGPVSYSRNNNWSKFLAIEFQALIGVTGALIQMNKATMANGANFAFRKSTFKELNGYHGIFSTPSGDDELFMAKVKKMHPDGIAFAKNPEALVSTLAPENWSVLKQQRIRWASKWKTGKRASTIWAALAVLFTQFAMLTIIILGLITDQYFLAAGVILFKMIAELLFISKTAKDIGASQPHIGLFVLSFIIYPFYAIYMALLANFSSFNWKGRVYP